jgi:hypothetical protein
MPKSVFKVTDSTVLPHEEFTSHEKKFYIIQFEKEKM